MKRHNSMRGYFAYYLHQKMKINKNIWVVSIDLGYGMLDHIRKDFPDRFINTGAAEQSAMGIAVGLALKGKIPFVYSITPFLLWRPAETIRLYLDHEKIPVKLIGGGRGLDYHIDGFSHNAQDAQSLLNLWGNIEQLWPEDKKEIKDMVDLMVEDKNPYFISLRR